MLTDTQILGGLAIYLFIVSVTIAPLALYNDYTIIENELPQVNMQKINASSFMNNNSYETIRGTWAVNAYGRLQPTDLEYGCVAKVSDEVYAPTTGELYTYQCFDMAQVYLGDSEILSGILNVEWNITGYDSSGVQENYFGIGNTYGSSDTAVGLIQLKDSKLTLYAINKTESFWGLFHTLKITTKSQYIGATSPYSLRYRWDTTTGDILIYYNDALIMSSVVSDMEDPIVKWIFGTRKIRAIFYTNSNETQIISVSSVFAEVKDTTYGVWEFIPAMVKIATYQLPPGKNGKAMVPPELWVLIIGIPELLIGFMIVRLIRGTGA